MRKCAACCVEAIQQTAIALRELIEPPPATCPGAAPLLDEPRRTEKPMPGCPSDPPAELQSLLKALWQQAPALARATRDPVATVRLAASRR